MDITDDILTHFILLVYMTGVDNGWVYDLELAKKIILAHFDTSKYYGCSVYGDKSMDDWLDKVRNNLQEFNNGDFSIMREGGWFLGGPDGWSGFVICTLDAWLDEFEDMDCSIANEEVLSVCEVDGEPVVFVLHESD